MKNFFPSGSGNGRKQGTIAATQKFDQRLDQNKDDLSAAPFNG